MTIGSGPKHNGYQAALGMGGFSQDFSQISADISAGQIGKAFSDPLMGVPSWVWLSGAVFVYLFLFTGGEYSRVSRGRRAVRKGIRAAGEAYA